MARYSYSALESFNRCPQLYKFRYVDKVKIPARVSADMYLGNVVHRALRLLYTHGADGVLYPLDKLIEFYNSEWDTPKRKYLVPASDQYTIDDYMRIGREMLETFYERHQPFREGTLLGSEMRMNFVLPGSPFEFTAIVDLLLKKDNGTVEIRDFKTGQRIPSVKERGFYYQMGLYRLALKALYPQYEDVELTQYFLRKNEKVSHKMSPEELDRVGEEFRNAVMEIKHALRLSDFPTKEATHCRYCEYFQVCPAKRHKQVLEEADAFEDMDAKEKAEAIYKLASRYIEIKAQEKNVKSEIDALKNDLLGFAKETGLTAFEGDGGKVKISLKQSEKFVTKTEDADAFAALVSLARELGLDEYMTVDANALYKEAYQKERLSNEGLQKLKEFIRVKEDSRISVQIKADDMKENAE